MNEKKDLIDSLKLKRLEDDLSKRLFSSSSDNLVLSPHLSYTPDATFSSSLTVHYQQHQYDHSTSNNKTNNSQISRQSQSTATDFNSSISNDNSHNRNFLIHSQGPTTDSESVSPSTPYTEEPSFSLKNHASNSAAYFSSPSPTQPLSDQDSYIVLKEKLAALELSYAQSQSKIELLNNENSLLMSKLSEQIALRSTIQLSKEEMTEELEELTRILFEEANQLVAKESRQRYDLEQRLYKALDEITHLKERLNDERNQLTELKERIKKQGQFSSFDYQDSILYCSPHIGLSEDVASLKQRPYNEIDSIWRFMSLNGLDDIWPESFEEWKRIIYYEPYHVRKLTDISLSSSFSSDFSIFNAAQKKPLLLKTPSKQSFTSNNEPDILYPTSSLTEPSELAQTIERAPASSFHKKGETTCSVSVSDFGEGQQHLYRLVQINPKWIFDHIDPYLFNEFLNWIGRRGLSKSATNSPLERNGSKKELGSSGSSLIFPILSSSLPHPDVYVPRPSTPNAVQTVGSSPNHAFSSTLKKFTSKSFIDSISSTTAKPSSYGGSKSNISFTLPSLVSPHSFSSNSKDPFIRRVTEEDILPTLTFHRQSKSFSKRLLKAIASHTISLERIIQSSFGNDSSLLTNKYWLDGRRHHTNTSFGSLSADNMSRLQTDHSENTLLDSLTKKIPSALSLLEDAKDQSSSRIRRHNSQLLDDRVTEKDLNRSSQGNGQLCCELCGNDLSYAASHKLISPTPAAGLNDVNEGISHSSVPTFRLRLSESDDNESSMVIDGRCRTKIVTVCDFFSFIRYFGQGLYDSLSNEHLYLQWLQLKRAMMYARVGAGPYFIASDTYQLLNRWKSSWVEWNDLSHHKSRSEVIVQNNKSDELEKEPPSKSTDKCERSSTVFSLKENQSDIG